MHTYRRTSTEACLLVAAVSYLQDCCSHPKCFLIHIPPGGFLLYLQMWMVLQEPPARQAQLFLQEVCLTAFHCEHRAIPPAAPHVQQLGQALLLHN